MIIRPSERRDPAVLPRFRTPALPFKQRRQGQPPPTVAHLRVNYLLWLLLVLTNVTDVLASRHALAHGAVELNPLVARLLEAHGINGLMLIKGFWLALLLVLVPYLRGWVQWLYASVSTAYVLLAAYHLYHL